MNYWEEKSLSEMNKQEWEGLCDGCARCCLHKLEDADSGEVHYTAVVCRYLDENECRCSDYEKRTQLKPGCVQLTPQGARDYTWLPSTCAYRTLAEGRPLEWWHPLVSGSPRTVHEAGVSIRGKCIPESHVHPDSCEEHIIRWVDH